MICAFVLFSCEKICQLFRYLFSGMSVVPLFMGPAVTPWNENNNPSMRLYTYSKLNRKVLDYDEYFLNLTSANKEGQANWRTLYKATESYKMHDLSSKSMQTLLEALNKSKASWPFKDYLQHFSTGYVKDKSCNSTCWMQHICSIKCVNFDCFDQCLETQLSYTPIFKISQANGSEPFYLECPHWDPTCVLHKRRHHPEPIPVPDYMYPVIYGLVALVFVLFFVVTVLCCCWPTRSIVYLRLPRHAFIRTSEYEPIDW